MDKILLFLSFKNLFSELIKEIKKINLHCLFETSKLIWITRCNVPDNLRTFFQIPMFILLLYALPISDKLFITIPKWLNRWGLE